MINIHIANSPIKIVIVVMFFLLPCFAFGQEIIVVSTGFGDVISGRESMARDRALENAMRNAVEQAVGTLVQSETVINNGSFIKDEIEVQSIIEVSLDYLFNASNFKSKKLKHSNQLLVETPYFDVYGHTIWGATAMMVNELKVILKEISD